VEPKMYVAGDAAATAGTLPRTPHLSAWAWSPTCWTRHSSSSWP
jgi:hypothetical protein